METKIFYFTRTGNLLVVAKNIANKLENTELISIPAVINEKIESNAESISIIFPVYMWGNT